MPNLDLQTWTALAEIIGVNIVLSGDNAVVIALAARSLPPAQQKKAVVFGSLAAIVMRILLTIVAAQVLALPWLRIIGSALLLWIGIKLLVPAEEGGAGGDGDGRGGGMVAAIRTILIADLVMSLDNVIAVAAAAKGSIPLLIIGLAISIPLIIFGSAVVLKLMDRFPVIVTLGGALLGFVAGEMLIGDAAISGWVNANAGFLHYVAPGAGAVLVVIAGKWLAARAKIPSAIAPMVDLAEKDTE
jgi:YjbE family integral membrane protein